MQQIRILAMGRLREPFLRQGCLEYEKRLARFCALEIKEFDPAPLPERPSPRQIQAALEREGALLQKQIKGYCVAMCVEGVQLDSIAFAKKLSESAALGDGGCVTFLLGSSYGLSDEIKKRANLRLSMSKMTFPHQLARLLLLEQIYRAYQIQTGGKYHK